MFEWSPINMFATEDNNTCRYVFQISKRCLFTATVTMTYADFENRDLKIVMLKFCNWLFPWGLNQVIQKSSPILMKLPAFAELSILSILIKKIFQIALILAEINSKYLLGGLILVYVFSFFSLLPSMLLALAYVYSIYVFFRSVDTHDRHLSLSF
jgi:hypothetical protein